MQVDVSAPGDNIYTTNPAASGSLWVISPGGTPSLATAHVSGLAALLFSYLGTNTPVDQIYATIKYSTHYTTGSTDVDDNHRGLVGTGTINNYQALQMAQNTLVVPTLQYPTISAAMNAASSGETVYVRPGTYNESVSLKSGVKLVASRSDVTTINGIVNFNGISNAEIAGFTISSYLAVNVYNSTNILIRNCRITGGTWGVTINYAHPTIRHCEVVSNSIGIYLSTGAGTSVTAQNNRISSNNKGFYVQSTPTLNNLRNSVNNNATYHLEATSGSGAISAQRNWWDPLNSGKFSTVNGIDYTNHLTNNPIPADHTPPKAVATRFTGSGPVVQDSEEIRHLYRQGREQLEEGSVEMAIELFQQVVEQFPEARLARVALKELVGAWHQQGAPEKARSYLQAVRDQGSASPLPFTARRLQFDLHVLQRQYEQALEVAGEIDDELAGTETAEEVAFEVAQLWMFGLNRPEEGAQKLRDYLASYPAQAGHEERQIRRQAAHVLLGEPLEEEPGEQVVAKALLALELEGPNPFNAQTVVSFYLPETSEGSLVVYNALVNRPGVAGDSLL